MQSRMKEIGRNSEFISLFIYLKLEGEMGVKRSTFTMLL